VRAGRRRQYYSERGDRCSAALCGAASGRRDKMSKINYQALREAAEAAKGKTTWQKIQAFKAVATPEVVLELLDRIERRPAPEAIMQHVFYSLLSKGHTESEAMYAVMKCVESYIPKMVAHTEPLSCTCVRSGGAI